MNRIALYTMYISAFAVAASAAIALGGYRQSPNAEAAACTSNLKQACLATLMYSQDYDEKLPPLHSPAKLVGLLNPYTKNAQVYRCPATKKPFTFNKVLQPHPKRPVAMAEIKSPAKSVLVYDPQPHADGTTGAGFLDGHVKRFTKLPSLARQ